MRASDGTKPPDSFLDKQGGGQGGNNGGSGSGGNSGNSNRNNAAGRGGKDNGRDNNRNGGRGGEKRDNNNFRNNNDNRGGMDNKGGKSQSGNTINTGNGGGMRGNNPEDRRGDKGGDKSLLGKRKDKDDYSSAPSASKVFVGGLDYNLTEDDFRKHFETKFGPVKAAQIVRDANSGQSKGFGFVTF